MIKLQLRIPEAMHEKLVDEAHRNHRSINSEILWRIEQMSETKATRKMITKK